LPSEIVDEAIVVPVGDVVEVLHADDLGDDLALDELLRHDVAQADVTNESLTFQPRPPSAALRSNPPMVPTHCRLKD
jgi:hypothetical protein